MKPARRAVPAPIEQRHLGEPETSRPVTASPAAARDASTSARSDARTQRPFVPGINSLHGRVFVPANPGPVIEQPAHEPLGPFVVRRQTTGAHVVVDRRRPMGKTIVAEHFANSVEAIEFARRLAAREGFTGKEWHE